MEYNDDHLKKDFDLVKNIIQQNNPILNNESLDKIAKIIDKTLPEVVKKTAPVNFPEIYFDFKYEYEKFKEFILYNQLIGKNIIALGGGFSSGKSSFLNSLLVDPEKKGRGRSILPANIDPSTSVPTYIVNNEEESTFGINIFENKVDLNLKDLKSIAHGFGEISDEDGNDIGEGEIKLGHILNSIFLSTPKQKYKHIAFLDTPGYSKPDTKSYSKKTDEKIARAQLNSSNFILWFMQADDGTIRQDDIEFLNSIKKEIPKLIIINKADKLTLSSIEDVKNKVREVLDLKGINYEDVLAYSVRAPQKYDGEEIVNYLKKWDQRVYESTFARNFKVLFVKCKDYYEKLNLEENKRLNRLNTALTMSENTITSDCLTSLINEIKRKIDQLKGDKNNLQKIQDEFFTEIKNISDKVGIEMPEPSEIDLIEDKIKNPIDAIKQYKEKQGIKSNPNLSIKISDIMANVDPVIDRKSGGAKHKDEIFNSIRNLMDN